MLYAMALAIPFSALTTWLIKTGARKITDHFCE